MLAPMPRPVRRPRAGGRRALAAVTAALALAGCGGIGQPAPYDSQGINGLVIPTPTPDPDDFVAGVDNPWLPLEPGSTWHYDVTEAGRPVGTIDVEVDSGTTEIAGLSATAVRVTTDTADGIDVDLGEVRFYAQDEAGNVWLLGAESEGGTSWRAGEGGAQAGLAMPADPRVGDGWITQSVPGLSEVSTMVEDQSRDMVQTREVGSGEADTTRRHVYDSGVGLVSVEDLDAGWLALLAD